MSERTPEIIRDLREKHEYKQEIIAKYLGVVQQTYSNYEKGHTSLPLDYLVKLAKFYGVSADYLLGLTSFQKPFSEMEKNLCTKQNARGGFFCTTYSFCR